MTTPATALTQFHWEPQPQGQRLLDELHDDFLSRNVAARNLSEHMRDQTGTRFKDWVDFIEVPNSATMKRELLEAGFSHHPLPGAPSCFVHEGAMFPAVLLGGEFRFGIKVDSIADFLAVWQLSEAEVVGQPLSQFRMARAFIGSDADLWVVERHGYRGFEEPPFSPLRAVLSIKHMEAFRRRERNCLSEVEGFARIDRAVDAAVSDLGPDWACDLFFAAEREYWQRRNRAAQVQKARQDRLGLGWANHDHHTYRSSRENFTRLVAIWEKLGLKCRESFYAGAEAGWGAQVMEQAVTGITTFNDVDLSAEELMGDFAHTPLPKRRSLGTVGLWCGLHGEAALQAGMHHLECQFDHHALVEQLEQDAGIHTMAPFTTFPYLRQAFTQGERWPVLPGRVRTLLDSGLITEAQAAHFRNEGAIGSHLENLERNDGFKGFNQEGVSDIIARTDPRRHVLTGA